MIDGCMSACVHAWSPAPARGRAARPRLRVARRPAHQAQASSKIRRDISGSPSLRSVRTPRCTAHPPGGAHLPRVRVALSSAPPTSESHVPPPVQPLFTGSTHQQGRKGHLQARCSTSVLLLPALASNAAALRACVNRVPDSLLTVPEY
ncbi:hypothetical protein ZWY2020_021972 [Hordeum vulgare]|nr:hypothetical protein ZWY2020_021972 [Hordeum vulgare]